MKILKSYFSALIILAIMQVIYYFPRMPETLASHFDGLGDPNGWSSKIVFFAIYAAVLLLTIFIFVVFPDKFIKSSGQGIKIANKEYWLAPERREATIKFYRSYFLLFGIANAMLAILTIQFVIHANFKQQPRLDSAIVWVLVLYFIFVIAWLIRFYTKFRRIP